MSCLSWKILGKRVVVTAALCVVGGAVRVEVSKNSLARADYGGYSNYGNYGGYSNYSYGGNYGGSSYGGGGGSSAIISLELDENKSRNTGLRVAARRGELETLKRLIGDGGDVNSRDDYGKTALMYASSNCYEAIVSYLLSLRNPNGSAKVNANIRDNAGRTALMHAAGASCSKKVVPLLLEVPGIELFARDRDGRSLRDYALNGVQLEMGGETAQTYREILDAERAVRHHRNRGALTR